MSATEYPRDLVGYGRSRPDPRWPGGARLALNIVLNYEEGSEYSFPDGDGASETQLLEATPSMPPGTRDLNAESIYEYGSRVGFWRLADILAEFGVTATVFGCALALERNPQAVAAIRSAGYDVCSHGWRWIKHWLLKPEEEAEHIRRAVGSLSKSFGERPLGWYCRTGPSVNTRRLIVEEGGFLYDSDSYSDELPYWDTRHGRPHLVIPYSVDTNDTKFANPAGFGNGEEFLAYLKDSFDCLYREGAKRPGMMSVGLHMRLAGRPGRAEAFRRFLDYVRRHEGVWICRRADIARHWIATHPFKPS
jgi:putative urate catabolism protein